MQKSRITYKIASNGPHKLEDDRKVAGIRILAFLRTRPHNAHPNSSSGKIREYE